jgi:hypothetical protein
MDSVKRKNGAFFISSPFHEISEDPRCAKKSGIRVFIHGLREKAWALVRSHDTLRPLFERQKPPALISRQRRVSPTPPASEKLMIPS